MVGPLRVPSPQVASHVRNLCKRATREVITLLQSPQLRVGGHYNLKQRA